MLIKDLFERDIFRPINGVVKADQLDAQSVWQELDEFVMAKTRLTPTCAPTTCWCRPRAASAQ